MTTPDQDASSDDEKPDDQVPPVGPAYATPPQEGLPDADND
jgi:hypothetical protein